MAEGAIEPEQPGVKSRIIVAGEAGCGSPNIAPALVTLEAGRVAMGAGEREAGKRMVEGHLRPAIGRVAGAAIITKLTTMLVILLVASHTLGRCVDKLPPLVTAVAGGF